MNTETIMRHIFANIPSSGSGPVTLEVRTVTSCILSSEELSKPWYLAMAPVTSRLAGASV